MPDPEAIVAPRPWVQVAVICHTALIENTGQLSIVRITDRLTIAGSAPQMQPYPIQLTMALVIKSGEMQGQYNLRLRVNSPTHQTTMGQEIMVFFEGGDRGVQSVIPIAMVATETGTYWFDLLIEEDILTRVPLTVLYQRIQLPPGMIPPGVVPPIGM